MKTAKHLNAMYVYLSKDAVFSLQKCVLLVSVITIWPYAHPLLYTPPSMWYYSFVDLTDRVDLAYYSLVWNVSKFYVPFVTCTGYSFGLNRQRTLFWRVISWNVIYKNIQFRFAKPNMSSQIIGWLVVAQDGKILGF